MSCWIEPYLKLNTFFTFLILSQKMNPFTVSVGFLSIGTSWLIMHHGDLFSISPDLLSDPYILNSHIWLCLGYK